MNGEDGNDNSERLNSEYLNLAGQEDLQGLVYRKEPEEQ